MHYLMVDNVLYLACCGFYVASKDVEFEWVNNIMVLFWY